MTRELEHRTLSPAPRRVGGVPHWLFAAATADATVFAIAAGRGTADAATRLDADFDGFLVRDGAAGEGSDHGVRVATGRLEAELERLLEPRYRSDENRRLANHLDREFPLRPREPVRVPEVSRVGGDQLSGRAGDPARRGYSQGVGRESHPHRGQHAGNPDERPTDDQRQLELPVGADR